MCVCGETEAGRDGAISPRYREKQYWAAVARPTLPEMIPSPILCLPRPLGRSSPGIRSLDAAAQGGCGHQPAINSFVCAKYHRDGCLRCQNARAGAAGACQHQITHFGRILLSRPPGPLWWHRYPPMSFQSSLMHLLIQAATCGLPSTAIRALALQEGCENSWLPSVNPLRW